MYPRQRTKFSIWSEWEFYRHSAYCLKGHWAPRMGKTNQMVYQFELFGFGAFLSIVPRHWARRSDFLREDIEPCSAWFCFGFVDDCHFLRIWSHGSGQMECLHCTLARASRVVRLAHDWLYGELGFFMRYIVVLALEPCTVKGRPWSTAHLWVPACIQLVPDLVIYALVFYIFLPVFAIHWLLLYIEESFK